MRKKLFMAGVFILLAGYAKFSLSAEPVFNVTKGTPVIQNMVPGSTQNLSYTINVPHPPQSGPAIIIKCALTLSNSLITATGFNTTTNGCINGVGFSGATKTAGVNLPLVAGSTPGTTTMTLTFTMDSSGGTHPGPTSPPVVITSPITITNNANRTITFKNYCNFPVYFGVSSGTAPAKNAQNSNTACTTDSNCSALSSFSRCVSGYCGGGYCVNGNNLGPGSTSTDCAVQTDPNAGPPPADPSPCENHICSFCNGNSDCITGGACNTTNHQCYWITPAPADSATNHYKLNAYSGSGTPAQNSVSFTSYTSTNGYSLLWSGGIAGRTGCGSSVPYKTTNACYTAGCNLGASGGDDDSANGGCNLGEGFGSSRSATGGANPVTQAEFTLVSLTADTYDVTVINGTNIPVNMTPVTDGAGAAIASPASYGSPYQCGRTGSNNATAMNPANSATTLGGCSWNFENSFLTASLPLNLAYRWVNNETSTYCTEDSPTCTNLNANYVCGLTSDAVGATPSIGSAKTTCGTLLGYWTQDEICAANKSYNPTDFPSRKIVDCTATGFGTNTLINLLACTGPAAQSCYTAGADPSICCGCTDWTQVTGVPSSSSVITLCTTPNSTHWVPNVLPGLNYLKQACPSAYVYPFDDKASTFTCPQNGGQSGVNYVAEFCPGQKSGGITVIPT